MRLVFISRNLGADHIAQILAIAFTEVGDEGKLDPLRSAVLGQFHSVYPLVHGSTLRIEEGDDGERSIARQIGREGKSFPPEIHDRFGRKVGCLVCDVNVFPCREINQPSEDRSGFATTVWPMQSALTHISFYGATDIFVTKP